MKSRCDASKALTAPSQLSCSSLLHSSTLMQVETDPARAVVDDDGDEPLMRQETDGRKPFAVPKSRRRKQTVVENASLEKCGTCGF